MQHDLTLRIRVTETELFSKEIPTNGKAGLADLTRDNHGDPQYGSFETARSPSTLGIVAQVFGVFQEESKKEKRRRIFPSAASSGGE